MMIYHTNGPKLLGLIYQDCLSMLSDTNRDTMERSLRNSPDAWVAYHADTVLGFCGLIPPTLLSETAYFWFYATPEFGHHRLAATRVSRRLVRDALNRYPNLVGHCTAKSARWLRWLGASLGEPQGSLIPFEIKAQ